MEVKVDYMVGEFLLETDTQNSLEERYVQYQASAAKGKEVNADA